MLLTWCSPTCTPAAGPSSSATGNSQQSADRRRRTDAVLVLTLKRCRCSRSGTVPVVRYSTTVTRPSQPHRPATHAGLTRDWLARNVHCRLEDAAAVVTAVNNAKGRCAALRWRDVPRQPVAPGFRAVTGVGVDAGAVAFLVGQADTVAAYSRSHHQPLTGVDVAGPTGPDLVLGAHAHPDDARRRGEVATRWPPSSDLGNRSWAVAASPCSGRCTRS